MPVGMMKQQNHFDGPMTHPAISTPDGGLLNDSKQLTEKINMEAYQAYYNTNEAGQVNSEKPKTGSNDEMRYPQDQVPKIESGT